MRTEEAVLLRPYSVASRHSVTGEFRKRPALELDRLSPRNAEMNCSTR